MAVKAIVGEKVGMTQLWGESQRIVPVTVLRVTPVRVVQVKSTAKDGYEAIQVTYGFKKARAMNKPEAGHYEKAGVAPGRRLVELRLEDASGYSVGQEVDASLFEPGDRVDVSATTKGKGFAGGMKRHGFKGQGASHGNHKKHRAPGSVGACATPSRVFKGTRMAGRMGANRVTTLNLEVVQADPERQLILVRGSVPGPAGAMVTVRNSVLAVAR
jgi:large subunit ribosomal protein L3